jgi:hypothetical protein
MNGTGSELYPMAGFGINGIEPLGSVSGDSVC